MATGVSAGLASHLGWPVGVVRAIFVVLSLLSGMGILLYVWFWALMPFEPAKGEADTITRSAPVGWGLVVLSAFAAGLALFIGRSNYYSSGWSFAQVAPPILVAIVLAVAASFWVTFIDRTDPERGRRTEKLVRTAATLVLGVLVLSVLFGPFAAESSIYTLLYVLLLLFGIALVFAPVLVRLWRELGAERTRRVREEQRSEIAAHLHDSVLQTLALIQNRAGASSEVARIARAQERELRSWLFEADVPADSDLATDLRDWAAALELDYPVRMDVVDVGESGERASGEIAAAAREAMLNAARHAGGEVSVYVEGTAHAVEVFVRDRGPGFEVADVAADRLGVRESIIGRMRRAGGSATVRAGAGGTGTEVSLRFGAPITNGAKPAASAASATAAASVAGSEQTTQNGVAVGG
ncbi:ATP-binding protein [Microterricola viridarii]|uniref:ATP-binding protein n=1 Tax=Microterricola viridarii TaxID=412690 RepID=UPI000AF901BE|nr:ATP-binding protein [Microterricola viridarii]